MLYLIASVLPIVVSPFAPLELRTCSVCLQIVSFVSTYLTDVASQVEILQQFFSTTLLSTFSLQALLAAIYKPATYIGHRKALIVHFVTMEPCLTLLFCARADALHHYDIQSDKYCNGFFGGPNDTLKTPLCTGRIWATYPTPGVHLSLANGFFDQVHTSN